MSQLFEDGKVVTVDGVELECVGVSYQETDGERHTFGYTFRPKEDVDAERKAEEAPVEIPTEPEVTKEETLNVK